METDKYCPNCASPLHLHLEEIELDYLPSSPRPYNQHKFIGWYECANCQRMYVSVTLKRFEERHIRRSDDGA